MVDAKDSKGETALCHATRNGHDVIVNCLLANAAKSDVTTADGLPLVFAAVPQGRVRVLKALFARGYSPDTRDKVRLSACSCVALRA